MEIKKAFKYIIFLSAILFEPNCMGCDMKEPRNVTLQQFSVGPSNQNVDSLWIAATVGGTQYLFANNKNSGQDSNNFTQVPSNISNRLNSFTTKDWKKGIYIVIIPRRNDEGSGYPFCGFRIVILDSNRRHLASANVDNSNVVGPVTWSGSWMYQNPSGFIIGLHTETKSKLSNTIGAFKCISTQC